MNLGSQQQDVYYISDDENNNNNAEDDDLFSSDFTLNQQKEDKKEEEEMVNKQQLENKENIITTIINNNKEEEEEENSFNLASPTQPQPNIQEEELTTTISSTTIITKEEEETNNNENEQQEEEMTLNNDEQNNNNNKTMEEQEEEEDDFFTSDMNTQQQHLSNNNNKFTQKSQTSLLLNNNSINNNTTIINTTTTTINNYLNETQSLLDNIDNNDNMEEEDIELLNDLIDNMTPPHEDNNKDEVNNEDFNNLKKRKYLLQENDENEENNRPEPTEGFISAANHNFKKKKIVNINNDFLSNFINDIQSLNYLNNTNDNNLNNNNNTDNNNNLNNKINDMMISDENKEEEEEKPPETFGFVKSTTIKNNSNNSNFRNLNNNNLNNKKDYNSFLNDFINELNHPTVNDILNNNEQVDNNQINNKMVTDKEENERPETFVNAKNVNNITKMKEENNEEQLLPETIGFVSAKSTSNFKKPTTTLITSHKEENDEKQEIERLPETFGFVSAKSSNHFTKTITNKGNVMVESLPPATNGFISAGKSTKSNFLQNFIKDLQEPLQQKEQTFNKQESDDDEINDEDLKEILQHEELLLEKEKQEKPLETFGFVKANNNFIKKQSTLMNENIEMNNNEMNNNEMNNNDRPPETFGFVNAKNVNNVKKHTLQNAVQTTLQNMLLNNNQLNNQQLNNNQQDENKENDKPPETFGFVSAKSSSFKKPSAITPQKVEQEENNETENNDKPPETFGFVSAKSTNSSNFKKPTTTIVNNSPNKVNNSPNNVDNSTNQERPPETFGFVSAKRSTGNNNFNNKNSNNKNNKQQKSSSFLDSFMKDIQNISNLVDDETKQLITIDNNNNDNDNNNDNNERPPATSGFISAASTKSSSFNSSPSSSSFKTPLKTMNNQQQQQKQQQQQTTMTPKSDFLSKFIADVNNGTFSDNNENNNSSTLTTPFKTPSSSSGVNNSSNNNNSNRRLSNVSSSSSSLLSTPQSSSQMSTSLFKTPQKRDVKTPFSAYYNNSSNNNKTTTTTPTTTTATPTNRILSIPKKKKFVTPMKSLQAFEEAQRRERNNIVKNTTNNGSTTLTTSTTKKEGSGSSLDPIIPPNWIPMKKTSLQRKATNSKKIPLSKLGTCQHLNLLKTKLNNSILEMNSLKAKDFKFNHKDFPFCKELQNLIFTIFKKNLEIIGVDEIFKICKHLGIVNRKIEWFDNHYRFIVWKLACMDRTFPNYVTTTTSLQNVVDNHVTDNFPEVVDNTCHKNRFLTCEKVIGQLIYRYNVEYCLGKRSCLQQITEQDQPPSKFMILMVASISSNNTNSDNSENKIIELTDGWYSIKGKLDETLSRYVEWFKLREGQKLKICGAQFSEQTEAGHPLEISNCCITLNVNSVKLAKWDDPLGFQPFRTLPFKSTIKSIQPNGGTIPFLQVIVKRIFPVRFMEKLENGTFIVRSENAENKLKEQNERERERKSQFLMEKFTQEMSQKELQKMSQKKLSQKKNVTGGTPINRIYDGPSLYEALQNSNDKFTFYSQLQDKQRETLQNYENKLQQEKSQKIQEKIQMELENDVTFNRQVNSMMNVLIGDCCQFTKKLLQKRKLLNGVKNNTQNVSQNNCDNNCDNHSDNNTNIENNCDNNCDNIEMTENEDDISGITINEKEAMLTIWNPQIEHFELFKEGNIVDIFSSKPSKNSNDNNSLMKSINTTKFTKIRIHKYSYQLTNKEKELFHFKNRKVFKLIDLINPLNFVNENLIDLIGVVIFTKELPKKEKDGILKFITILDDTSFNNFTQNNCDNTLQNNNPHDNIPEITKKPLTLQISFLETMKKQYGYKLIENQIYCFFNLKFHEYSSQYNLIKCFVTDQTLICERPPKEFTHLKREFLLNFYNENKLLFENYKNLLKQQQFIYNNDYNKFVENNLEENLENNNLENSLQNPLQNNLENNLQNNSKNGKDELNNISCNLMIDIHHPITITLIDSSFVTLENYNYPTVHLPNNFNYLQNFKNSLQNSLQNNLQNNNELYSYYKNCEDIYTFTMKCYLQNNSINGREQIIKLNENLFDQFINCTFLQQEENSQTTILQNTLQNNKNYNLEEIPLWINKLIQEGIILEDVDDYSIKVPDIILNLKDCMNHHYMAKSRLLLFRNLNTSINKSINNSSSINSSSSINNNKDNKMEDDNNEMKDEEEEEEEMMINKKEEELNNNNFSLSNVLKLIFMKTKFILNVNDFDEEESIKNQLFYCTRKEWHYLMYHFINTFIKPLYRFVLYNSDRDVKEIECLCLDKDELNLDF
ncbi:hypothetical protein ABK040_003567 [Willaertia magna]